MEKSGSSFITIDSQKQSETIILRNKLISHVAFQFHSVIKRALHTLFSYGSIEVFI